MRRFARENGLSLFFFAIFAAALVAQSLAGVRAFNAAETEHGGSPVSWWTYVTSPEFGGAVVENWQSEFLQFSLFIAATIWLVQKGSNESKKLEDVGLESKEQQRIGRYAPENAPNSAARPSRSPSARRTTRPPRPVSRPRRRRARLRPPPWRPVSARPPHARRFEPR